MQNFRKLRKYLCNIILFIDRKISHNIAHKTVVSRRIVLSRSFRVFFLRGNLLVWEHEFHQSRNLKFLLSNKDYWKMTQTRGRFPNTAQPDCKQNYTDLYSCSTILSSDWNLAYYNKWNVYSRALLVPVEWETEISIKAIVTTWATTSADRRSFKLASTFCNCHFRV